MSISTTKPLSKRLVGVSTKMYFDLPATEAYIMSLRQTYAASKPSCALFIFPSDSAVRDAIVALREIPQISIGAQNCHWEDHGPYTGETSAFLLSQIGCTLVELRHAERRQPPLNEDDAPGGEESAGGGEERACAAGVYWGEESKQNCV